MDEAQGTILFRSKEFFSNPIDESMMIYTLMGLRVIKAIKAFFAVLLVLLLTVSQAMAGSWTAGTADWQTGANWAGGVPGASDSAIITNGGTAQLTAVGGLGSDLLVGNAGGESGTVEISANGSLVISGVASNLLGNAGTGTLSITGVGASASLTDGGLSFLVGNSGTGTVNLSQGGTLTLDSGTGQMTLANGGGSAGTLNIGTGGTAGIFAAANVNGGSGTATLNFNLTDADYFFTSDGTSAGTAATITGSIVVNKSGTGKTTLIGANTYSGITTISAGTLQIGSGGTAGTLGSGNVTNNSALIFNRSDAISSSVVISGTGTLEQAGAGTLTLTGANTYSGVTTISAGKLVVDGSIASSTTTV
ncbi:MAG: autotransporter-associated beta strand repeat-containing protein, partial [Candidatus Marinimicrobia bacterium]|nr:autotransporter-associated beta strand repeat-containing protein [Candidatus Neomarinimicrobiota bacterium]